MSPSWVCADVLHMPRPKADLVVCDPPYGTGKVFRSFFEGVPDLDDSDVLAPTVLLAHLLQWAVPLAFFCEPQFLMREPRPPEPTEMLFWKTSWISGFKSSASFPRQVDVILLYNLLVRNPVTDTNGHTIGNLIDDNKLVSPVHKSFVKKKGGLPVEKGIGIGKLLTEALSNPGATVIDVCCGTGSLAAGAELAGGRNVIGVDVEREYLLRALAMYGGALREEA